MFGAAIYTRQCWSGVAPWRIVTASVLYVSSCLMTSLSVCEYAKSAAFISVPRVGDVDCGVLDAAAGRLSPVMADATWAVVLFGAGVGVVAVGDGLGCAGGGSGPIDRPFGFVGACAAGGCSVARPLEVSCRTSLRAAERAAELDAFGSDSACSSKDVIALIELTYWLGAVWVFFV